MKIYVNDNPIEYIPMFPLTWGNFFQKLLQNEQFINKDHGIVGFRVDGKESLQVMTDNTNQMVPETINKVEIFTKNSLDITRDGCAKIFKLIEGIKSEITLTADLYREGKLAEASSKIVKIMEAIKPMVNFVQSVGVSFSLNFDELMFNSTTSLRTKVESFLNTFSEMVNAQQKKDYVELADYLEYQLIDDMDDWNHIVALLLQEVEMISSPPA